MTKCWGSWRTTAPYIRSALLVSILLDHMPDNASYFVYFGSRTSQPARARAFVDLAVERLSDCPQYVLTDQALAGATSQWRDRCKDDGRPG
jgi:hypothetical protein